jgi:hypothetical protein
MYSRLQKPAFHPAHFTRFKGVVAALIVALPVFVGCSKGKTASNTKGADATFNSDSGYVTIRADLPQGEANEQRPNMAVRTVSLIGDQYGPSGFSIWCDPSQNCLDDPPIGNGGEELALSGNGSAPSDGEPTGTGGEIARQFDLKVAQAQKDITFRTPLESLPADIQARLKDARSSVSLDQLNFEFGAEEVADFALNGKRVKIDTALGLAGDKKPKRFTIKATGQLSK